MHYNSYNNYRNNGNMTIQELLVKNLKVSFSTPEKELDQQGKLNCRLEYCQAANFPINFNPPRKNTMEPPQPQLSLEIKVGRTSPEVMLKHYRNPSPQELGEAVSCLDSLVRQAGA